ncbi:MAG: adenylate kinase [Nitrospirae bacterium]|nr:adenylate kinase [Nitrospirota bacterium]
MRLIFLGPPGVGKGTQAQKLSAQLRIPKISTGDILREAVSKKTALGLDARSFMESGKLVPDEVVIGIIRERMIEADCRKGFILDGFPRTEPQARALALMLNRDRPGLDRVLNFELSETELVRRLSGRRSCPNCQAVYHVELNPSRNPDRCDRCDGKLIQRSDDHPETIRKRLEVYQAQTLPLIRFYEGQGVLTRIDGSGSPDGVYQRVMSAVGKLP